MHAQKKIALGIEKIEVVKPFRNLLIAESPLRPQHTGRRANPIRLQQHVWPSFRTSAPKLQSALFLEGAQQNRRRRIGESLRLHHRAHHGILFLLGRSHPRKFQLFLLKRGAPIAHCARLPSHTNTPNPAGDNRCKSNSRAPHLKIAGTSSPQSPRSPLDSALHLAPVQIAMRSPRPSRAHPAQAPALSQSSRAPLAHPHAPELPASQSPAIFPSAPLLYIPGPGNTNTAPDTLLANICRRHFLLHNPPHWSPSCRRASSPWCFRRHSRSNCSCPSSTATQDHGRAAPGLSHSDPRPSVPPATRVSVPSANEGESKQFAKAAPNCPRLLAISHDSNPCRSPPACSRRNICLVVGTATARRSNVSDQVADSRQYLPPTAILQSPHNAPTMTPLAAFWFPAPVAHPVNRTRRLRASAPRARVTHKTPAHSLSRGPASVH